MDYLELDDKHMTFVALRNDLDSHMKSYVDDFHGHFSEFTTPLMSQEIITKFSDQLKTTLPAQHTSITVFINKNMSATSDSEFTCTLEKSHVSSVDETV